MEPICFIGIIGIAALAAGVGAMFAKGSNCCSNSNKEGQDNKGGIDAKKEKAIEELTK